MTTEADISVLLTVNIVSRNPPHHHRAVLIIFALNLQTITITRMLSSGEEGVYGGLPLRTLEKECLVAALEQLANLLCTQANSASYPQRDEK